MRASAAFIKSASLSVAKTARYRLGWNLSASDPWCRGAEGMLQGKQLCSPGSQRLLPAILTENPQKDATRQLSCGASFFFILWTSIPPQERKWRSSEGCVAIDMSSGPVLNGQSSSDLLVLPIDVLKDEFFYEKSPQIMLRWGSIWLL
jgi:hypothetical protein